MNEVTIKARWVLECRQFSTLSIDPIDFVMYEEVISKWENRLLHKEPNQAAYIIQRAFKIYLYDEA